MFTTATSHPSKQIIQKWWHNCSSTACTLPPEHTQEWLNLISEVVRNHRLFLLSQDPAEKRFYRKRCIEALVKSRWELMCIAMYGLIPQEQIQELEKLQTSLAKSL
ncbi:hypothetical protein JW933_11025 [candidate division FCPU426 bacterium]|nr:hypothetical protein [candidate division FCPU426 bacterium]